MREEFRSAPIHIYRDSTGDFSIQYNEDNEKGVVLYRKYLTDEDYKALNDLNEPIKYLPVKEPEKPEAIRSKTTILDCSSLYNQDAPSSFHIYYIASTETVHGNLCIPRAAYSRSFGKSLQNIKFNVYTAGYSGQYAHTAIIGWFKEDAHGHGMYFGDTQHNGIFDKQASGLFIGSTEPDEPQGVILSDWDIYAGFLTENWY